MSIREVISIFVFAVAFLNPIEVFSAQTCAQPSSLCSDATPCKTINGQQVCLASVSPLPSGALQVPQNCWTSSSSYQCSNGPVIDTCGTLESNPNCGYVGQTCVSNDATGACATYSVTYSCQSGGGVQSGTSCGNLTFCSGGTCFTNKNTANDALTKATAAMETAREAGYYAGANGIFSGTADSCTQDALGLANCCKPNASGGSFTDALIVDQMVQSGWQIGSDFVAGSTYTFDALFAKATNYANQEMAGIATSVNNFEQGKWGEMLKPSTGPVQSLSVTGNIGGMIGQQLGTVLLCGSGCSPTMQGIAAAFGYTAGAVAGTWAGGAAANIMQAGSTFTTAVGAGNTAVATICVSCIVITVAIIMIEALLACDQQEMTTQLKLGANLCTYIGSYCSIEIPLIGTCIQTTQSYCCFNSKLAQIINDQGRPQIGKYYVNGTTPGSVQSPDCSGFSQSQIQQIDFSKIDFSQFINQVKVKSMPDVTQTQTNVQNQENNYYNQTSGSPTIGNGMVMTYNTTTPVAVSTVNTTPPPPTMPACNVSVVKQAQTSTGDQPGTIAITSCEPNGNATIVYQGQCSSLSGAQQTLAMDSNGMGTFNITIPASCLTLINKWSLYITDPTNALLGQETVVWQ